MNYRITEDMSRKAREMIVNDEINERLVVLKNQLNFLESSCKKDEISNPTDVSFAKDNLKKIHELLDSLNFKKQSLEILLNDKLSQLDISNAVKLKAEMNKLHESINQNLEKEKELNAIIFNDKVDYDNQMFKLKEKYDNVDIINQNFSEPEISNNVISNYKMERASSLVIEFLDSLSEDKRQQVLNENENLKGYLNVGENI